MANYSFKQGTGILLIFLALVSAGMLTARQGVLDARETELRELQARLREYVESAERGMQNPADFQKRLRPLLRSASAPQEADILSGGNLLTPANLFPLVLLFGLTGGWMLLPRRTSKEEPAAACAANPSSRAEISDLLTKQLDLGKADRTSVATEFAASISHEIRNPLAGIQMSLSNLMAESEDPQVVERLGLLSSETSRVANLLGKAVEAARRAPEPSQQIDLAVFAEKLLELLRLQLPPNFILESDIGEGLKCNLPPNRLGHCLANLVINSAQAANGDEGWVRIEIRTRAEFLRVRVLDNGPGFPEEILNGGHRPLIASESEKIGLGLAMARRFVREMGGKLELSNPAPPGSASGSCVTILLPSAGHHG